MIFLYYILLFFCLAVIFINAALILFFLYNFKSYQKNLVEFPLVSVLIAARNEEKNIKSCMTALTKLDYPVDKLQILIGNDDSSDKTEEIAREFEKQYSNIKLYNINEQLGSARGKANVLAQLANKATGEVFFITDADVQVPANWLKGMLAGFDKEVGIVTGFTSVCENTVFARLQNTDWTIAIGIIKVLTDLGIPVTTMGNNMAITRAAYYSTGGYENIPFSITEDYELFIRVLENGFKFTQPLNKNVASETNPIETLSKLLQQRKRWLHGAFQLPWMVKILLFFQAIYYIAFIAGITLYFPVFIFFGFLKITQQIIFIKLICRKSGTKISYADALYYELYSLFISISSLIYYIFPNRIIWKERTY